MKSVKRSGISLALVFLAGCLVLFGFSTEPQEITYSPQPLSTDGVPGGELEPEAESGLVAFYPALNVKGSKAGNILFDQSHGSYSTSVYGTWITIMQNNGFNVVVASDFANLMNYDVVIYIYNISSYFTAPEVAQIQNYLNSGGILLIFGEYFVNYNYQFNQLLADLGVGIYINSNEGYVEEPVQHWQNTYWVRIDDFSGHCLNDNLNDIVLLASAYFDVTNPSSHLFFTTAQAHTDTNPSHTGPFGMAAIPNPSTHPSWKIAVAGDYNLFTDTYIANYDNMQMAENWILWCEDCTTDAECDDGVYCNGAETCDLVGGSCVNGPPPCTDDGLWCNGTESCDEANDQCITGTAPCPDDGVYCNGVEGCDEILDQCTAGTNPCPDDLQWCNGTESCDEANDQCLNSGSPCADDGVFCNGAESCDEAADACVSAGDPCADDGLWCNGTESCDEANDQCLNSGDPCTDDGEFCNGAESCDEASDSCVSAGDPCVDDGQFCNGIESCDEDYDQCVATEVPCGDDGLYCNGTEACDEDSDQCTSTGDPCTDDGLFCNGEEACSEDNDTCVSSGDPCAAGEECNESTDTCNEVGDRGDDDDDDDTVEGLWPEGKVSGGNSDCCGCE